MKKFCNKCGKEIKPESEFCIFCGNEIQKAQKQPSETETWTRPDFNEIARQAREDLKNQPESTEYSEISANASLSAMKKQRQAGIFGAVMSVLFIATGFITLQPGMGIYFLIAGVMVLIFTVFMFVLVRESKKSYEKEMAKKQT